jgi:nitrate/nitrite transporter NarK
VGALRRVEGLIWGDSLDPALRPLVAQGLAGSIAGSAGWSFIGIWALKRLHAGPTALGLAFLAGAVLGAASGYFGGHLSDHVGRRPVMLVGSGGAVVLTLAFLLVGRHELPGLALMACVPALGSLSSAAAQALIADLVPRERHETAFASTRVEIVQIKEACGRAHLKVILETGELGTYDNVRRASLLAMAAGADFIKTSTGKLPGAATLPAQLVMLEAIRDVFDETGRRVGMKSAGGIRASKNAIQYLVQVNETLGPDWLTPDLYRLGASSLVNDILMQIRKEKTGAYQSKDYFTND